MCLCVLGPELCVYVNTHHSAAAAASVAVAAIAAAAAPPGEAILARTDGDATGAGAGVEGAYEAEMMEALAACGD